MDYHIESSATLSSDVFSTQTSIASPPSETEPISVSGEHFLSSIFPRRTRQNLEDLALDFRRRGQSRPIVVANNLVVCGFFRLEASTLAGIPPFIVDLGQLDEPSVWRFAATENLFSFDVSADERFEAAQTLVTITGISRNDAATFCGPLVDPVEEQTFALEPEVELLLSIEEAL